MVPILLSVTGGILLWQVQSRRRQPPLVAQLAPVATSANCAPPLLSTDGQKLTLSVSVLSLIALGHGGLPWVRLLSTPGILYLDLYFIRAAYADWQQKRQLGIATNDAVLATGLVVTRQWGACSLFATLFFASRKLQTVAEGKLAHYLRPVVVDNQGTLPPLVTAPEPLVLTTSDPAWQSAIDRGALPLLILSVVSTPLVGVNRALAVLLTNFGYDYRLVSPLSTLRYLQAAADEGIWFQEPHVLDRLQAVDVLVVDGDWAGQEAVERLAGLPLELRTLSPMLTTAARASLIADLQKAGYTVAYATTRQETIATMPADLVISVVQATGPLLPPGVHVGLSTTAPAQLQQLFTLTQALAVTRRRGLYFALAPGLLNLGGIYWGRFGVITALLVDYGGTVLGILHAAWLSPATALHPNASAQTFLHDLSTATLRREEQGSTIDGTA